MGIRKIVSYFILLLIIFHFCFHGDCVNSKTGDKSAKKLKKSQDEKSKADAKKVSFISFERPKQEWSTKIEKIFKLKSIAHRHMVRAVTSIKNDKNISKEEGTFHIDRFINFEKELNETEGQIVQSLTWLNNVLKGDYKDVINMRLSSKKRLDALRDATMKEEQEYNAILKDEEKLKVFNQSKVEGLLNEILQDVAAAANKLEADLNEHVFDNAMLNPDLAKGANFEAVIRLEDEKEPQSVSNKTKKEGAGVIKLVDVEDNQFVLSKGKDTTVPHEDRHFIQDVVYLIILCFTCGWLSSALGFPSMFGYIIGGILLGPSGFNFLKSLVQLETLGEFGIFFILFSVGLEFSPDKICKVVKVAVLGSILMMVAMVLGGLGLGLIVHAQLNESAFVSACLSLSSTPLIIKFLTPVTDNPNDEGAGSTDYGMTLIGILVMQDVLLGILIALLPNMASADVAASASSEALTYFILALKLAAALFAAIAGSWALSRILIGPLYKYLIRKGNHEITVLATVSLIFLMLLATEFLHISMELGSFLAGVIISTQGQQLSEKIEHLIQPIKDFLGVMFFASIGLHVFPSFMVYELTYLVTFTILTVTVKFLISAAVLAVLLPRSSRHVKWLVAAGLAQVSEFSFVLSSRARRLGLISREVYLLILSVTTLSLLTAPVLWRVSLWHLRVKGHTRGPESSHPSPHASDGSLPSQTGDEEKDLPIIKTKKHLSESRLRNLSNSSTSSRKPRASLSSSTMPRSRDGQCHQSRDHVQDPSLDNEDLVFSSVWKNSPCHGDHGNHTNMNGSLCNLLPIDDSQYGSHGNLVHRHQGNLHSNNGLTALEVVTVHHSQENIYISPSERDDCLEASPEPTRRGSC